MIIMMPQVATFTYSNELKILVGDTYKIVNNPKIFTAGGWNVEKTGIPRYCTGGHTSNQSDYTNGTSRWNSIFGMMGHNFGDDSSLPDGTNNQIPTSVRRLSREPDNLLGNIKQHPGGGITQKVFNALLYFGEYEFSYIRYVNRLSDTDHRTIAAICNLNINNGKVTEIKVVEWINRGDYNDETAFWIDKDDLTNGYWSPDAGSSWYADDGNFGNPLFNNNSIDSIKIETESYNFLTDETAIIVKSGSGTTYTNLNYYNSRDFDNSLIEINGQFRTITEFVNEIVL